MAKTSLVELFLSCGSWQEAQNIADELLEKGLVACVEFMEIRSKYRWKNEVEQANEIKLILLTKSEKFDEIEKIVDELHGYETFVLVAVPVTQISNKADVWVSEAVNV